VKEWNREKLFSFLETRKTGLVYFFTPLCGTCQVASKMLQVINELVQVHIGRLNLNFFPDLAKMFEIESVPCLLLVKEGEVIEKIYTFHSIPFLMEKINKIR
jgi:thioredoxin-like negative regulator of GroEL